MHLYKQLATNSWIYQKSYNIKPIGIMVHSTGCNNPNLRRYVAPDDGRLGTPSSANWNQMYINGKLYQIGVHAFIGKLKDGSIATYQVQNWNRKCNHCGKGPNGTGNTKYISFEICEDDTNNRDYFEAVYKEAVEFCAYLCNMFGFDPLKDILCHSEGHDRGIASNHGDVMHWFPKFGKNMDIFRKDVKEELEDTYMMDDAKFAELMKNYQKNQGAIAIPGWAEEEYKEVIANKISDGSRPLSLSTRLEAQLMTNHAYERALAEAKAYYDEKIKALEAKIEELSKK